MNFFSQIAVLMLMIASSMAFFGKGSSRQSFGSIMRSSFSMAASPQETAKAAISSNKVMVFSKTTCPYCRKAKDALTDLKVDFGVIELDKLSGTDGVNVQAALAEMTGQRTVPNIFINGKHLGGCDSLLATIASGKLQGLISAK